MTRYLYLLLLISISPVVEAQHADRQVKASIYYRTPDLGTDSLARSTQLSYLHSPSLAWMQLTPRGNYHEWEITTPSFYHGQVFAEGVGWGLTVGGGYQFNLQVGGNAAAVFYLGSGPRIEYNLRRRKPLDNLPPDDFLEQGLVLRWRLAPGLQWNLGPHFFFNLEAPFDLLAYEWMRVARYGSETGAGAEINTAQTFEATLPQGVSLKASLGTRF